MPNDIQFQNGNPGAPVPATGNTPPVNTLVPSDVKFGDPSQTQVPSDDPTQAPNTPTMFQGFMQSLVDSSGLPRFGASIKQAGLMTKDISHDIFGTAELTPEQKDEITSGNIIVPGANGTTRKVKAFQNPIDAMGVGLSASSFITPVGEAGAGFTLAKQSPWIFRLLKETAPFAVTQALGQGAQDVGEGKSAPQALTDTALNYVTSVASFGLLKGFGGALKATAGALLKSDIVKAANKSLLDFVGKTLSLDGRFAQGTNITAKDAALQTSSLTKQFEVAHKEAIDAFAKTAQTPTNFGDVYKGVIAKVNNVFDSLFKAKDAKYGEVFTKDMFPNTAPKQGAYGEIFDALDRSKKVLGLNDVSPEAVKGMPVREIGRMAYENQQLMDSPAGRYISDIEDKIGTREKPNAVSMHDLNQLYTSAPVSPNVVHDKAIADMMTSMYRGAGQELQRSTDPRAKAVLSAWDEAHTKWSDLRNMMNTKFANTFKNIGDAQAFVEKIMSTKPGAYTQKIIDALDPETRAQISDIIYNKVLQVSRSMSADYNKGGAAVEKMLDTWSPTGLITPQHESVLRSYASAMQGTYEDLASYLKNLTTETPEAAKTAIEAGSALEKAKGAQGAVKTATTIEDTMNERPLFKKNEDGSYDFSNLSKVVDKINTDGRYDGLVKQLEMLDKSKEGGSGKVLAVTKGVMGASLFHTHPFVALGLMRSSIADLFGKSAEKITTDDLSKYISEQVGSGKMSEEQFNGFLMNVLTGKFKVAGDILSKVVAGTANQAKEGATDKIFPQAMPDWFKQEFENQTGEAPSDTDWQSYNTQQ